MASSTRTNPDVIMFLTLFLHLTLLLSFPANSSGWPPRARDTLRVTEEG